MSANCDDTFQQIQDLQRQVRELEAANDDLERMQRAATPVPRLAGDQVVTIQDRDGQPMAVSTADAQQFYREFAGLLTSQELDAIVRRGFGMRSKPIGSEGRFVNYDLLLQQVGPLTPESYAKLTEAFNQALRTSAPEEQGLLTTTYGREKIAEIMGDFYRQQGVPQPDVLARAAAASEPARQWVEELTFLRFHGDRSKRLYLDALGDLRDYMRATSGGVPPDALKQNAFEWFKTARFLDARQRLVTRKHAQSLRSLQEDIWDLGQFKLDPNDVEADQLLKSLTQPATEVQPNSHIARVIEAVDNNDPRAIDQLIQTAEIEGVDPSATLDEGWLNAHMRMGTALIKDSMLMNLQTQFKMNLGSNAVMFFYGPVQQMLENGFKMTPVGSFLTKDAIVDSAKVHAQAFGYARTVMNATWKRDLRDVFWDGIGFYNGNVDFHGTPDRMSRSGEIAEMQSIIDMPYIDRGNPLLTAADPHNMAMLTNKLQAAARILVFTQPRAAGRQGPGRLAAAWAALNPPKIGGTSKLSIAELDTFVPWKPALRGMAAVDEVFGKFQYLYKLSSDLQVEARMKAGELGLDTEEKRMAWVEERIGEAVYMASPTEANIKAFRETHGIKSELTDDDIAAAIAERNLAGSPTMATEASVDAMAYSQGTRFQQPPEGGDTYAGLPRAFFAAGDKLREHWAADRFILPFWRSPINAFFFDMGMAGAPLTSTARLIFTNPTPEQLARTKAAWVMSGAMLSTFGLLEGSEVIFGQSEKDPAKRNTIFGMKVGGLPLLNTLFLWKDVKDAFDAGADSRYDPVTAMSAVMKILTAQIVRQSGLQQFALIMDAMQQGNKTSLEKLRRFVGFMGAGQIPFTGAYRNLERGLGIDPNAFYRERERTPEEQFYNPRDDDSGIAKLLKNLEQLAYDTIPSIAAATDQPRKTLDHLGNPIGHVGGIDFSKALPFFPARWPAGKENETVYAELDRIGRLDPPKALLDRRLDGITMTPELQEEYNELMGTLRAPKDDMQPSAALSLAEKLPKLSFRLPVTAVTDSGIRVQEAKTETVPLVQYLDKVTPGATRKEAFYKMFTSEWYQRFQADPLYSTHPPGGLPASIRRERPAVQLADGLNAYYDFLAKQQLELRARDDSSAAAKEWSEAKTGLAGAAFELNLEQLKGIGGVLQPTQ